MTEEQKIFAAANALDVNFHLHEYIKSAVFLLGFCDKNYVLPREILQNLLRNRFEQRYLQELVENITFFLGIPFMARLKSVAVLKTPKQDGLQKVGCYSHLGNIEMRLFEHHTTEQIVALACHECVHAYLTFKGINYGENYIESEIFTEVAAVYLGFGEHLRSGYSLFINDTIIENEKKLKKNRLSHRVGYITGGEIKEIMEEFFKFRVAFKKLKF